MTVSSRSKVTSKYQATIPAPIREALGLRQGDTVVFEASAGQVVLRRALPLDGEYLGALAPTLSEWDSPEDDNAYRDL